MPSGLPAGGNLVAMLFCQLGRAHSLREITNGLRSCEEKLKHLGITAPKRSTWTSNGIYFVTRMKDNALYKVVETKVVPQNRNIIKDEIILLTGVKTEEKCPYPLRRVEVYDSEKEQTLVFFQ